MPFLTRRGNISKTPPSQEDTPEQQARAQCLVVRRLFIMTTCLTNIILICAASCYDSDKMAYKQNLDSGWWTILWSAEELKIHL